MNKDIQELLNRVKRDSDMRTGGSYDDNVDRENVKFLHFFVEKYGWPRISEFGEEVSTGAWLLAQHGGFDPEFQQECLHLMKQLVRDGDVDVTLIPYLEDRIRVIANQNQIYGTQLTPKNGQWVPKPIENRERVNILRKEFGLEPLEEYIRNMNSSHPLEQS